MTHDKLTEDELNSVVEWVSAQLISWEDIEAKIEANNIVKKMADRGTPLRDDLMKWAKSASLVVGGGHGDKSHKASPTYKDLDLFFLLPRETPNNQVLYKQLRSLFFAWRLPPELDQLRKNGGVVEPLGKKLRLEFHIGKERDGVLWYIPLYCPKCQTRYYDMDFTVKDEKIIHNACAD